MMKNRSRRKGIRIATTCLLVLALKVATAESKAKDRPDYLKVVKAYADTLIEHGRDT